MTNSQQSLSGIMEPQCQYFVLRKKRLCRMTVRPGRKYCGEHEPQPKTIMNSQEDTRIPCPNDPKHTVYISKLKKHLSICNARATEQPPYIVPNINAPAAVETCLRKPLSQLSREIVMKVIEKVNYLYDKHVKDNVTTTPEYPIHSTVMEEFTESDRAESSLRHLRQVSSLLWLAEKEGLVGSNTCYVELGAGKGHVSYYACSAWCGAEDCSSLLVDRASLRHKRDNALRGRCTRVRADLAHLALQHVPAVERSHALVGLAKHLCGVATDYALRCVTAPGVLQKTRGLVLATCCHHRCERAAFVANQHLQELGINAEEFNVMLGIVSWATCGDGRSRESRRPNDRPEEPNKNNQTNNQRHELAYSNGESREEPGDSVVSPHEHREPSKLDDHPDVTNHNEQLDPDAEQSGSRVVLPAPQRELVGRRAKLLLDWARVLHLRGCGFDARLCYFVPRAVSLENACIVAKKCS